MTRKRKKPTPPALPMSPKIAAPTRPRVAWQFRVLLYGSVVVAAVAFRLWFAGPTIPRPDLTAVDPDLIQAIDDAEARIRRAPRSAEAWGELGLVLSAQSFAPEAEACLARAAELDRASWRWPFFQAASQSRSNPDQAVDTLREAIVRDGSVEWPQLMRAELLVSLGRDDEADRQFRELLSTAPGHARGTLGWARLLLTKDQLEASLTAVQLALTHPSTRHAAHELWAQIDLRRGKPDAARETLAKARALPRDAPWPGDPLVAELETRRVGKQYQLERVAALAKAGATREADAATRQAEMQHHDLYLLIEGRMQLVRGDPAAAEQAFREGLTLDPGSIELMFYLGKALSQQKKAAAAAETFRKLIDQEPSYGPAWLELGRCLRSESPEQSLAALQAAAQYMPTSAEAHAELAQVLVQLGRHDEAQPHADRARELKP